MNLVYVGQAKNTKNVVAPYKKNIMYPTISIATKTTPILIFDLKKFSINTLT